MNEGSIKLPLVLAPTKIYNYTQLVFSLRKKQQKLAAYKSAAPPTPFRSILRPKQQKFSVEDIVDGFLHNKLNQKQREREKEIDGGFMRSLGDKMRELKRENDLFVVGSSKISGRISDLEEALGKAVDERDRAADASHFTDPMLHDVYLFLHKVRLSTDFNQELQFLGDEYMRYIERFLRENADKIAVPLKRMEDKVSVFVRLRYNREEYRLETYEGRYVFAELYTLFRCGLLDEARELLEKFNVFFEHISHKFRSCFSHWLATKNKPSIPLKIGANEDLFKVFLLGLVEGTAQRADGHIISSVEDFIWLQLLSVTEPNSVPSIMEIFRTYSNPKGLLLLYAMLKEYNRALELVFRSDFPIVPSYLIMRALCPKCSTRKVFVDFVFLAASKFSSTRRKVQIVESLKDSIDGYYTIVPEMIVKTGLYEVLGVEDAASVYLDRRINERVVEILKSKNEKKKLVKLYYLVDNEQLVINMINETLTEAILADTDLDDYSEIIQYYERREDIKEVRTMKVLRSFYLFKMSPDLPRLRNTPLFDLDFDLSEFKYVVEKVLRAACDVVEKAGDQEMARCLFRLCGVLGLSDSISNYVNRHLVLLI
jgi:hypothetical protein